MTNIRWISLLILCGLAGVTRGQTPHFEDGSSTLVVARNAEVVVDGFVDTEACYSAIEASVSTKVEETGDRGMDAESYVTFVQKYGPTDFLANVTSFSDLPLTLQSNFFILACLCQTDSSDACCEGSDAVINTDGAFSDEVPTSAEKSYLFLVCSLTSASIDRVLSSEAPTSSPTGTAVSTSAPTASLAPSEAATSTPTSGPSEETVVQVYGIGIVNGTATFDEYSPDLITAMDSLAPQVLQSIQRRQLRHGRRLQNVALPTSITDSEVIECPTTVSSADRCESITASIVLIFQNTDQDPAEVAATFEVDLAAAIQDGGLQDFVTSDAVYILDDSVSGGSSGESTSSDGISAGGIAGAVIGSLAVVALAAFLVSRRKVEPKEELRELPPNPEVLKLDAALGESTGKKELGVAGEKMAAIPKDHTKPLKDDEDEAEDKQMLLPVSMIPMDDDGSSNAGDSGWSSSAGISSLNTGSVEGLEAEKSVAGVGATLSALSERVAFNDGPDISDSDLPNIPTVSRTDLDNAIEAGDWAAVGATAALLAAASDSQSYSSKSEQYTGTRSQGESSVSSLDAARVAELDHLVDAGDWEGVVLAAAKFQDEEGKDSLPSESVSGSESRSQTDTAGPTVDSSVASSRGLKRQEYRAIVVDLVQRVVPEELQNVDEMMLQFRGREDELVETLRTMQERAVAQKARHSSQRAAKAQAKLASKAVKEEQKGNIAAKSMGTGTISAQASAKSMGTGKVQGAAKGKSLGTGTIEDTKSPGKNDNKQSALEAAIEAGDWDAVGNAAAVLTDNSMASSADSEEINRLADGLSTDGSSVAGSAGESDAVNELEQLIEAGDWTGVVQAASAPSTTSSQEKQKEIEDARRQRRLKHLQEEQEALAQAEIWAAIAEQSKQDVQSTEQTQAAAAATDWAISRSLNALVEAEQSGLHDESTAGGSEQPRGKDNDDDDSDMEV